MSVPYLYFFERQGVSVAVMKADSAIPITDDYSSKYCKIRGGCFSAQVLTSGMSELSPG